MRLRRALALVVFATAFGAGFALVRGLAPERVRREIEVRLADALGGPVAIGRLRIGPGLGLRLHAEALTAWPAQAGPLLRVERVEGRLHPLAFLIDGPIFGTLRLEGVQLALGRDRSGNWEPPPLARLAQAPEAPARAAPVEMEAWLEPVAALESLARALLGGSSLADSVEVQGARVVFRDASPPAGVAVALELGGLEARLRRHRILGGVDLFLRGKLLEAGAERGTLEVLGNRGRDGSVELAVATTALDLATLAPYLPREDAQPIAGTLSGYLGSKSRAPGENELEMDLVVTGLRSVIPGFDGGQPRRVEIGRVDLAGFLDISPDHVELRELRFENGQLRLELSGRIARPLATASPARLSLALRDLDLDELRELLAWLPQVRREQAAQELDRIEAGRVANFQVDGTAPLSRWQAFLSGRERELPERFSLQMDIADARLRVGDSDRLEQLSGHLVWSEDRLEVSGARALLKGNPLPVLDLRLEGASNFLAGDPERRRLAPGGEPLRGLGALFDAMGGEPDPERPPLATRIRVEAEAVDHPVLLYPVEQLGAEIALGPDGVRVEDLRATWAGVPVSGRAEFAEHPERTARIELAAGPPTPPAPPVEHGAAGWARGRFEVERVSTRIWKHERASGRFVARGARFDFSDVEADLPSSGQVFGTASLDFAHEGSVPYRASFQLEKAEVRGVADVVGLPPDFATGKIDLAGSFEGVIAPQVPGSNGLTGLLSVRARDGLIRRVLPAVVAIALASKSFNPFTGREQIRYDRAESVIEFADGRMHTEAFSIDGPDLRIFASGDLALADPEHPVNAHVVLFLFRQIDNVIGKIPVLNLLLGPNENLLAAYYNLTGPWGAPDATLVPLRSLATGPASLVVEGVPFWVRRGLQAIGAIDADAVGAPARAFSPEPPPRKDS